MAWLRECGGVAGGNSTSNSEQVKCPVLRLQGRVCADTLSLCFLVPFPDSVNTDLRFESQLLSCVALRKSLNLSEPVSTSVNGVIETNSEDCHKTTHEKVPSAVPTARSPF